MSFEKICFVCGEPNAPLFRVCKCETLIHAHCMHQLVNRVQAHHDQCPVCQTKYDVRQTSRGWKCVCRHRATTVVFLFYFIGFVASLGGLMVYVEDETFLSAAIMFWCIGGFAVVATHLWLRRNMQRWCICDVEEDIQRSVHLHDPLHDALHDSVI